MTNLAITTIMFSSIMEHKGDLKNQSDNNKTLCLALLRSNKGDIKGQSGNNIH